MKESGYNTGSGALAVKMLVRIIHINKSDTYFRAG